MDNGRPTPPPGRKAAALAPALAALLALPGCGSGPAGGDDAARINQALLRTLTSGGERICVDGKAYGEPLAIFRTMLPAPDPARRPLGWHPPSPLREGPSLTGRQLADAEFRGERIVLPERAQGKDKLPQIQQVQLNGIAKEASLMRPLQDVGLDRSPAAPLAKVRWWVLNRLDRSCGPVHTVSKPVIYRDMAFVSVTAGHQGTTYAFRNAASAWTPVAKWSTWLY